MNTKSFHRIFFLFLLSSFSSFSQTPEDSKKKYPIRNVIKKNNTVVSTFDTPITNANFQDAINTCLATNPVDGMCSDSEYGAMPDWDVSQVNDMSYAFRLKTNFNGDLSAWDVSNVTTMFQMFGTANNFNGNISSWDVSNVTIMMYLFSDATSFNQPLEDWDVSNVTEMRDMFKYSSFNQDISGWCVTNIDSEPSDFSIGSPLTESNKPVWGTCPTAGIEDQNQLNIFIFPNPTSDIVYIEGNYTQLKVVVYDILRKQVMNEPITDHIDISQLDKGIYILQLSDGVKLTTQRILKN